jgi:hypothetical protein
MASKVDNTNKYLTNAAISLGGAATLLWAVPQKFNDDFYEYKDELTAPFNGLTNFQDVFTGDNLGRMPSFLVLAFIAIFLLQLRRR